MSCSSHLAKLGFRGETVFKPCEALSGGELARLRFAEIVLGWIFLAVAGVAAWELLGKDYWQKFRSALS